ncbi:MAG: hypothetical protein V7711_19045 [Pseudomonadales bacterium]
MLIRLAPNLLSVLLLASCSTLQAQTQFEATDLADETLHSRTFSGPSRMQLARACLSVIQDLNFQITETEPEPLTIVSSSPTVHYKFSPFTGVSAYSLTVSVRAVSSVAGAFQVRLALSPMSGAQFITVAPTDFSQSFFSHIDKSLYRQGVLR